jgi:hypothetical protein
MSRHLGPRTSGLRDRLAGPGQRTGFHAVFVAAIATGVGVLATAGDLGPYAPMLIALGIYAIVFGMAAEGVMLARWLIARWARWSLTRSTAGSIDA